MSSRGSLLLVGDIHLGRRPVGLDEALHEIGLHAWALSPAAAFAEAVRLAVDEGVRAVVLAGDVVDGERDRFEAYAALEEGVAALLQARIPTLGVAGNHDGLVLPRLAERLPGFHLLGAGGRWECRPLPGEGQAVDLLGWSFPRAVVHDDPLAHPSFEAALARRRPGATLLGVVHGDLGATNSPYAPLSPQRLERSPADAWFLGHVHRPHDLRGDRPIGYLGSLVGLDPGEPGARGPWLVQVDGGVRARQVPLGPIRWEDVQVPLDEAVRDVDEAHARLEAAAEALADDPAFADPRLRCVVVRARLTGRPGSREAARALAAAHRPERDRLRVGRVPCIVQRIEDATRPAVDLHHLAAEPTPAGQLARTLIELRAGQEQVLTDEARALQARLSQGRWAPVSGGSPPLPPDLLERAVWRALDALLAQRRP